MQFIPFAVFIPILAAIGYCDLKYNIIPNKITYPAAGLALILNAYFSTDAIQYFLLGGLASFALGFALSKVANMGGGDIKLLTLIGLMFGYPWFLIVLFFGFLLGGLVLFAFVMARGEKPEETPLGVYLAISGVVVSGWLIFVTWGA